VGPRPVLAPAHGGPAHSDGASGTGQASGFTGDRGSEARGRQRGTRRRRTRDRQAAAIAGACDTARARRGAAPPRSTARAGESRAGRMAWTTVAYWQHVGTGEVFAVWVDANGRLVSARGPLAPADIEAALFGDPARGAAWRALPTLANAPADAETDAVSLDHGPGVTLDREADTAALLRRHTRRAVDHRTCSGIATAVHRSHTRSHTGRRVDILTPVRCDRLDGSRRA